MIRVLDLLLSIIGLIVFIPFFLVIIILLKYNSHGPIFYRQTRVGVNGIDFQLFKFRTMYLDADKRGLLTVGERDSRVTKIGYYLRKYKFDELPQLLNVLLGDMSIVGPRPEVRKYVELYDKEQKEILNLRPGITDWASIRYRNENEVLSKSDNPEKTYIEVILPEKIKLNLLYIKNPSIANYLNIIFSTILSIFR